MRNRLKYIQTCQLFSLYYIAVTFPLSFRLSNIGIIFLLVSWVAEKVIIRNKISFDFKEKGSKTIFWAYIGLFAWHTISLIYARDFSYGLKTLEEKLSLLVLPIILYDMRLNTDRVYSLLKYYIYSIGICTLVLLIRSVTHFIQYDSFLTYHDFTRSLDFHAVFYSYYTFFAVLLSLYFLYKNLLSKMHKGFIYVNLLLFLLGLIFAASKNVLVVSVLLLIGFGLYRIIENKLGIKEVIITSIAVLVGLSLIFQVPSIRNRMKELSSINGISSIEKIRGGEVLTHEDRALLNGTSVRLLFWYIGLEQLKEENRILIGLNPADRRDVINQRFYEVGLNPWYENYNLHNQFIQILVELGVVGLFLYLSLHFGYFKLSFKYKNYLLLTLLSALVIFQMTESVLERNKGIVFFIFFLLLLQKLNSGLDEDRHSRN